MEDLESQLRAAVAAVRSDLGDAVQEARREAQEVARVVAEEAAKVRRA